ncbi:Glycine receptor subunit alpha-3 [Portunus trituberculatus]|uniref:Glycine receptor subunit alpha-3 n=1 Tax=Portunus trituberculatus TaxID=210409 RepID=A0A5B7CIC6_PORTR|nr:Glycine receptor subunit alpha-3 [Portunus trituberculatus]
MPERGGKGTSVVVWCGVVYAAGVEVVKAAVQDCLVPKDCPNMAKEAKEEERDAQRLMVSGYEQSGDHFLRGVEGDTKTKENESATSVTSPARNASEVVLEENVEQVVISLVKRDTMLVSGGGGVKRHRSLSGAYLHGAHTKRVRHRRHKQAQTNSSTDPDNFLSTRVRYPWEQRQETMEEEFNRLSSTGRVQKGGRRQGQTPPVHMRHGGQSHGTSRSNIPKFLVRRITKPKFLSKNLPSETFVRKMNFKGYLPEDSVDGEREDQEDEFHPFLLASEKTRGSKANTGDLITNMLSPLVGNYPRRTKAKGHKVLGFDHQRSHTEELYNQVSGSVMPGKNSRRLLPDTLPTFPLLRHNKNRKFRNKFHGGFALTDQGREDTLTRTEAPQGENAHPDRNLLIFGTVADDAVIETIRGCTRHVKMQLTDHYSIDDMMKEATNPLRQLVVYVNLISVNYEGYSLVLERMRHILDYLSVVQGGLALYSVIPSEQEAINTTRSAEVKSHLITLSDSVLDHCARLYPTCYQTYHLTDLTSRLQKSYDKDSGFDVYHQEGREEAGCSSNEVCGTSGPPGDEAPLQSDPREQLQEFGQSVCRSSYHVMIELEANLPTYDFEDENRFWENAREESIRVRAQTGLVLHDILPLELKKYDKNRPPKYEGQATIVYFHVTVLSVDSINEESMTYVADIFLAQSWRDHRLRLPENMTEEYRILDVEWLQNIWRPDCFFKNAKKVTFHEMSVPNHYLWLYHDKTLLYMAKLTLVLSCAMKFEAYPHDTQICSMMIESLMAAVVVVVVVALAVSHTTHDLVFKWNETDPLVVNPDIELPQLDISRNNTEDCTLTYSTGNFTCLAVVFNLRRRLGYHLFHTYVPSAITVVMSWISFWIKPEAIPARVTLGVTSLLTLAKCFYPKQVKEPLARFSPATQNQQSQSSLPPVSYIKAIDVWMSSCTVFVFASLLQFGLVNYFMDAEPLSKDMTGYSVEDLTDLDEKKSDDGRLNGYSHSRTRARSRSRSRMRSHSPGVPQYVVHRCTGKDIALYIDKFSRGFFPFAFFVLNISYWTTYGTM